MNMKQTLQRLFFVTALGALIITSSCKKDDDPAPTPTPTPAPTVAGYVTADTSFSILLAAVSKAGLAGALSTAGTYTVFAPTNKAFRDAGITTATIASLDSATVKGIVSYHALGATVSSTAVPASDTVKTLNGKNLFASNNANGVFVNGIKVVTPNVAVSNGIIHVIGTVLTPPTKTIAAIVIEKATAATPEFSLLLAAVVRTGLAGVLSGAGKYTVFAPTNAAFSALGAPYNSATAIAALGSADSIALRKIVLAHVIGTNVFAGDLIAGATANTANPLAAVSPQQTLTIGLTPVPNVKITTSATSNVANIVTTTPSATFNIVATNGVIHVIDKVLL
jgi:uncharacterized surface protein with fasciclin (FAS1) repeats